MVGRNSSGSLFDSVAFVLLESSALLLKMFSLPSVEHHLQAELEKPLCVL